MHIILHLCTQIWKKDEGDDTFILLSPGEATSRVLCPQYKRVMELLKWVQGKATR